MCFVNAENSGRHVRESMVGQPFVRHLYSNPVPEHSLNIYNAASSQKTLGIMLMIAGIGVPVVLAYTVSIYWIFRGKVKLDRMSY